jgi:hypothetical protein
VLSLCADIKDGALTGGDDGRLLRIAPDGAVQELGKYGSRWVEHVAAHESGIRACAVAKAVHVLDGQGAALKSLAHPSSVGGIAIDAKGKRIAASHYNGASLWFVAAKEDKPRLLEWKGSHHAIAIGPDGAHVVTAMQETALHGWRLADGQHMRMSGYPAKTHSLSFTARGKWLATAGREAIVLWPFFGGGPMGKAPTELAGGDGVICTRVACHPQHDMVAAGFEDGLVLLADIATAASCRSRRPPGLAFRRCAGTRRAPCSPSAPKPAIAPSWTCPSDECSPARNALDGHARARPRHLADEGRRMPGGGGGGARHGLPAPRHRRDVRQRGCGGRRRQPRGRAPAGHLPHHQGVERQDRGHGLPRRLRGVPGPAAPALRGPAAGPLALAGDGPALHPFGHGAHPRERAGAGGGRVELPARAAAQAPSSWTS